MHEIRTATADDLEGMKDVVRACAPVDRVPMVALDGSVVLRLSQDLNDMAVAVEDGAIIGFSGLSWPLKDNARSTQVLVAPASRRRGVGRALAERAITRGRALGCSLSGSFLSTQPGAPQFAAALGAREIGEWWIMVADLTATPEHAPQLPAGYAIRHARIGQDEPVFAELFRETFAQHRFLLPPPAPFIREMWARPSFDPAGVAFAMHEGREAGVSAIGIRAEYRGGELVACGHIGPVGVRAEHRQRGLARALLLDNLKLARAKGWTLASLEVDSINQNAIALYRSLGFEVARRTTWWRRD